MRDDDAWIERDNRAIEREARAYKRQRFEPETVTTMKTEVPGFPDYAVDRLGNVWTCKSGSWVKMQPSTKDGEHLRVTLFGPKGKRRVLVHRLILEVFVGPCPDGMEACHDPDPNPSNNALSNLRWDTRSSNHLDAVRQGRFVDNSGSKHGMSRLSETQVKDIRARFDAGENQRLLAKEFGIALSTINQICHRKRWRHIA